MFPLKGGLLLQAQHNRTPPRPHDVVLPAVAMTPMTSSSLRDLNLECAVDSASEQWVCHWSSTDVISTSHITTKPTTVQVQRSVSGQ